MEIYLQKEMFFQNFTVTVQKSEMFLDVWLRSLQLVTKKKEIN